MEKWFIHFVYCVLCCMIVGTNCELNINCCEEGQLVVIAEDRINSWCFQPSNNETFMIRLRCNNTVPFKSYHKHMFVNERMELVHNKTKSVHKGPGLFCIGKTQGKTKIFPVAVYCNEEEEEHLIGDYVFIVCLVISSVCLFLTAIIYAMLPELRDTTGKSIVSFCISLGLGLGILAALKVSNGYVDMGLCATRGFLTYFFLMASFFWSNAMSIQILRSIRRPSVANYKWREFLIYSLYAWGIPILLTVAMAVVNHIPGEHPRPGIGLNNCWFIDLLQQWNWMYSVLVILIVINSAIFIYILIILQRKTNFNTCHVKGLRYRVHLAFRCFVVMGISWIFEIISALAPPSKFLDLLDLVNMLQGLLIFLVLVVFMQRVKNAMYRKGWLKCIPGNLHQEVADDEEVIPEYTVAMSMTEANK